MQTNVSIYIEIRYLRPHFYSYPLMPSMTGAGVLGVLPNVLSPINTPPHWTSIPRATSDSCPLTNYAAAVMTTTQASFYKPLREHENYDNPFHVDSEDEDEPPSPVLLIDPAGVDTAVANTTDAAILGVEDAPTGKAIVKTTDMAPTADPPNKVTPAMKAAIVLAVVDALKSAMEIHLSPINSRLKGMQSDILSNHGHVTKRLFPDLEARPSTGLPQPKLPTAARQQ
jgi:hypothetical protein